MARQGFCDCCDTYRPLHRATVTGIETYACNVCSHDAQAYHRFARFGRGFIPREAYDSWPPIRDTYARIDRLLNHAYIS